MKKDLTHMMVDLETVDTLPTSAIISIGACVFDAGSKKIGDTFYTVVNLKSCLNQGLTYSKATLEWWSTQSSGAKLALIEAQKTDIDLEQALHKFTQFIINNGVDCVWGNGAAFDNAILSNCYDSCGKVLPWKFWNDRCYRTIKSIYNDVKMNRKGTHHNALDDAITQAEHLIDICDKHNLKLA